MVTTIRTIMVVDEEPTISAQIRASLQGEECDIISVATNREALEILEEKDETFFDLILINTKIPDSNKTALFSMNPQSKIHSSTEAGDFLEKPFTLDQLQMFIKNKLQEK
jgi:DNA-binding NtrC family response regulator